MFSVIRGPRGPCRVSTDLDDGKGIPKRLTEFKPGSVGVGISGMRQRVLKLENTNPGTLVQVVIPSTSAQMGEDLKQLKY